MTTRTPILIFALNRESYNHDKQALKKAGLLLYISRATGSYNHETENSYILHLPRGLADRTDITARVFKLVAEYNQESVLSVDHDYVASLIFIDGREPAVIGYFEQVFDEDVPLKYTSWTYDFSTSSYWVCRNSQSVQEHEYTLTWEIDIVARSPRAAAVKALKIQRDHDSIATVFDVFACGDKGHRVARIDLSEEESA